MGIGFELVCRRCRYSFRIGFGIGLLFPQVYRETIQAAWEGKLGSEVQDFLRDSPQGALDCEQVLLQCTSCGALDSGPDLSMYLPEDEPAADKPSEDEPEGSLPCPLEDIPCVEPWELKANYQLVKPYGHVCKECGSEMRVIKEESLIPPDRGMGNTAVNVNCPKCCRPMKIGSSGMWG